MPDAIIEACKPVYVASLAEGNLTVEGRRAVPAKELRQFRRVTRGTETTRFLRRGLRGLGVVE